MRRADRLFQIVSLLRAGRLTTARDIASHVGISVRTVYRDVDDLRESGVRIEGEAGVGYRLARDHALPPLAFDAEEIEALVVGVRLVERAGDRELALAARRALDKVEAVLPADLRDRVHRTAVFAPMVDADGITPMGLPAEGGAGASVRRAARERRRLFLTYSDGGGAPSQRVVWPLGLFWWGKVWSLGAWCELRGDFRVFRLDRVVEARVLDDEFPDVPERSLAAFFAAKRAEPGGKAVT